MCMFLCIWYTCRHCHFMCLYHRYTDTVTLDAIILCSCTTDTRTRYCTGCRYTNILYTIISCSLMIITLIYMYTCLTVSVFLLHESLLLLHRLLLHAYSCIHVTWLFLFSDIDIDIIICYWDISIIDLRCAELSAIQNIVSHVTMLSYYHVHESVGATSEVPRLMNHMPPVIPYMSGYPVTCYMYVHVMLSRNMLHTLLLLLIHCIIYL